MMHHATDLRSLQTLHQLHRDRLAASASQRGRPLRQRIAAARMSLAGWIAPRGRLQSPGRCSRCRHPHAAVRYMWVD